MPATLLARLSPDLGTGAGFHHHVPLQLLRRPPLRAPSVAFPVPATAPPRSWLERLAEWAESRPVHHRLGSWMLIGR